MQELPASRESIKQLPSSPGVYIFKNSEGIPVYIGKAISLASRVDSYFASRLAPKTSQMVSEATKLGFIRVATEIEALLLEAKLVKLHMPKYNSELKDDKSPLYIGITKEEFPRVLALRRTSLGSIPLKTYYGPFIQGGSVRKVLKLLRRIFPYSTHKPTKRGCIYSQIGLCNPCPSVIKSEIDAQKKLLLNKAFRKNLSNINKFLSGEFLSIKRELEREMRELSKQQKFEEAALIKQQLGGIEYITTPSTAPLEYLKDPNFVEDIRNNELSELKKLIDKYLVVEKLERIECFDIAHLSGTSPTASMVTFVNGEADKRYYRHFKVKKGNSDVDNMKEVLTRRLNHLTDWGKPDLIIVDGGKPQVSKALGVIKEIPLIGLAKRYETLVVKNEDKFIEIRLRRGPALYLVQRLRDEAHRFARRLHHKQVSKSLGI